MACCPICEKIIIFGEPGGYSDFEYLLVVDASSIMSL